MTMRELPETRRSLLLQLSQKCDEAWSEFLQIYERSIYDFCRRRGLQDADARDVTQEVLTAVEGRVRNWDSDPSKGKFRGWLFRVARNIAVDKYIECSRRAVASGDTHVRKVLEELPQSEEDRSTAFWMEYRRALMHWAAEQVRPQVHDRSWQAFWQTAVKGLRPEFVANQLGISVGSVYTAKCRVFARIKTVISQLDDDIESFESGFLNQTRLNQ